LTFFPETGAKALTPIAGNRSVAGGASVLIKNEIRFFPLKCMALRNFRAVTYHVRVRHQAGAKW